MSFLNSICVALGFAQSLCSLALGFIIKDDLKLVTRLRIFKCQSTHIESSLQPPETPLFVLLPKSSPCTQDPEAATMIFGNSGLTFVPFCLKPLYGLLIDNVSIAGRRCVPHMAFSIVFTCAATLTAASASSEKSLAWAYFSTSLFSAYTLTAVEALAASYSVDQRMTDAQTNRLISSIWLWYYVGAMVAGLIGAMICM